MSKIKEPPFDDAELERLLSHFEQAGPAVPEGVDDFCKAFEQWIQAGDHAEKDADDFRADLSFIRGMCDVARGDNEHAIEHLHEAIDASARSGNTRRRILAVCAIANCYEWAGMQAHSSDYIFEALALAEELGDDRIRARVLHGLSSLYQSQGAFEQMLESAMNSVAIAEKLDDHLLSLRTYSAVGLAFAFLDRADEGIEWLTKGLQLVNAETPPMVASYLNLNLMFTHRCAGRVAEAVRLAEQHLDEVELLPAPHAAVLYVDMAEIHLAAGNLDRAAEMLDLADAVSDPEWLKAHLLGYYTVASQLHEARGEPGLALKLLRMSTQLENELRGQKAQTRLVALERHFAAEIAAKTDELHYLRTVELVEKNDQLSALIRKNEEIVDVVVNDLRNPLAATRLLSDLLLTEVVDLTDSQAAHLVQSIKSATVDMSEAVERLVTEVRPEQ